MTEQEAKTKSCCGPEDCGEWQSTGLPQKRTCIGSACMAWRWDDYEQTDGYCGLAGRPPSGPA